MASILEIEVSIADTPGNYRVQIIESPGGEASATFGLATADFIDRLGDVQDTLLASSVPSRRMLNRSEERVRGIGQHLFEVLLSQHPVQGVYRASCAVAAERGETLRMVLRLNAPELAALPWESMFDVATGSYVCRREPLVRYVPAASSPPPLKVQLPLRILALVASPRGLAALDIEKEKQNLMQALARPIESGSVQVEWLEHTTWSNLQDALLKDSWHVIHFIGHGDYDIDHDEGVLALETEEGRIHRVAAVDFVDLLREAQPMPRLVVLNACETSTSGSTDIFSGSAAALVRGGVGAVTAMQFEISDTAAIAFSRGFYAAIARGRGVDEAVRSGRVAILGLGEGCLEWITPTLYLRGRETELFAVTRSPVSVTPDHDGAEKREQAIAGAAAGDVAIAVPLYDSAIADNPNDTELPRARERAIAQSRSLAPTSEVAPGEQDDVIAPAGRPDRTAELWKVAKRLGWFGNRPWKSALRVVATAIDPEERIIGCMRLPPSMSEDRIVVVTNQNVLIGTETPNKPAWTEFISTAPSLYIRGADLVGIPLLDVVGEVEIGEGQVGLHAGAHGTLLLKAINPNNDGKILQHFMVLAQDFS